MAVQVEVTHDFHPSTRETEAGGSLVYRVSEF